MALRSPQVRMQPAPVYHSPTSCWDIRASRKEHQCSTGAVREVSIAAYSFRTIGKALRPLLLIWDCATNCLLSRLMRETLEVCSMWQLASMRYPGEEDSRARLWTATTTTSGHGPVSRGRLLRNWSYAVAMVCSTKNVIRTSR